ncbi:MAG: hypothetical protein AAGI22_11125 [Planctomycetota bacterium]
MTRLAPLAALSALVVAPRAAAQASFFPIPLPPGGTESRATACSADGSTVVGCAVVANLFQPMRWDVERGTVQLGPIQGGLSGCVMGVSSDGQTAVGWGVSPTVVATSVAWPNGESAAVDLGVDPDVAFLSVTASDASANGAVVVGTDWDDSYVWTASTRRTHVPAMFTILAVTDDGRHVFGAASGVPTNAGLGAASWDANQGVTLLDPVLMPPAFRTEVRACSPDGRFLLGEASYSSARRLVRWVDLGPSELLPLGPGATSSWRAFAGGISADGSTVVGREGPSGSSAFRATLWTPALGTVLLRDHLVALGADGLADYRLLSALGISDDGNAIVGVAEPLDTPGRDVAYVAYLETPTFAIGRAECTGGPPTSSGFSARLIAVGSAEAAANDVTLVAQRLPEGAVGTFLCSRTPGLVTDPGASQGTLCLGGAIGRFTAPGEVFLAGPGGEARLRIDVNALPEAGATVAALPGETWRFQAWFREPGPPSGTNFTSSMAWAVE